MNKMLTYRNNGVKLTCYCCYQGIHNGITGGMGRTRDGTISSLIFYHAVNAASPSRPYTRDIDITSYPMGMLIRDTMCINPGNKLYVCQFSNPFSHFGVKESQTPPYPNKLSYLK